MGHPFLSFYWLRLFVDIPFCFLSLPTVFSSSHHCHLPILYSFGFATHWFLASTVSVTQDLELFVVSCWNHHLVHNWKQWPFFPWNPSVISSSARKSGAPWIPPTHDWQLTCPVICRSTVGNHSHYRIKCSRAVLCPKSNTWKPLFLSSALTFFLLAVLVFLQCSLSLTGSGINAQFMAEHSLVFPSTE